MYTLLSINRSHETVHTTAHLHRMQCLPSPVLGKQSYAIHLGEYCHRSCSVAENFMHEL